MSASSIIFTVDASHVAWLTLNRPERRNAFDDAMLDEWQGALERFAADDAARVLVVTGAPPAFCAGVDRVEMSARAAAGESSASDRDDTLARVQRIQRTLHSLDKPTIAAINGPARGAGADLALGCSLRLMARSATIAESYIQLGLVPGAGAAWLLPRIVGQQRALEWLWTGRVVDAAEAEKSGLVLRAVDDEQLRSETEQLARTIAEQSPPALRAMRHLVESGASTTLPDHLDIVRAEMRALRRTPEHVERVHRKRP